MVQVIDEVRLPRTEGGTVVYDSLWRVAERMFGDGDRWPELFAQNRGVVQADGRALTQPHLVRPGWKITGFIPAPVQTPEQSPQPSDEQPPVTPSQPPKTTTQPAPSTTTDHAGEQDPTRQPGLDLHTGTFVSVLLAGVISAAVLSARMWRRRRYRIGSGDRSDLRRPVAPVVRALRAAHEAGGGAEPNDVEIVQLTPSPLTRIYVAEAGGSEPDGKPVAVPTRIGVRGGRETALDLASTHGLGLLGPGATAAARALLLHLLAQRVHDGEPVRVLLPAADLRLIFDSADTARMPATVSVVDSLDTALDEMEAELVTRIRHLVDAPTPRSRVGTLVLLASPTAYAERRLQAVIDNGSALGLTGILLGQWRPGTTVRIRSDGTVSATSPGPADSLIGTRLFTLSATDTTELLGVLRVAEGVRDLEPTYDHDVEPDDRLEMAEGTRSTDAPGSESTQPPADDQADEDEPQPPLILRVLGRVELVLRGDGDERQLAGSLTPKQREVLVYLALHPAGARREALNEAIWPDSRPPRPFNSLHNALSLLRRALAKATDGVITDLIRNDDGRYQLDRDLVTTDFEQFQAALQAPRVGGAADALVKLNEAVRLYRGDLAEDVAVTWIEEHRESNRRDALDALSTLVRLYTHTDAETALTLLERARKLDPYNEGIYRDIIRTHARLGQYDAIPRTVAFLTTVLDDIDQQPSSDTLNLAEFLQRRRNRSAAGDNAAAG
jgi:DNA-binding SARP family transcriptional activator